MKMFIKVSRLASILHRLFFVIIGISGVNVIFGANAISDERPTDVVTRLEPTAKMRTETIYLIRLLEELHFAKKSIKTINHGKLIENFMLCFDANRMFFQQQDFDKFTKRFAGAMDLLLRSGNLNPAFEIFQGFYGVAMKRIGVVLKLLADIDFETNDVFSPDRKDAKWALSDNELDELWLKRLRYELLNEILSNASGSNISAESLDFFAEELDVGAKNDNFCKIYGILYEIFAKTPIFIRRELGANSFAGIIVAQKLLLNNILRAKIISELISSLTTLIAETNELCNVKTVSNLTPITLDKAKVEIPDAKFVVRKKYKNFLNLLAKIDATEVQELFLNEVAKEYDPHTNFFSVESMEDFAITIKNSLVGIGAYLSEENGYCVVKELLPGGPAERSNTLKAGDKILSVTQENGQPVDIYGMKLKHSVKLIRGPKGSVVKLLIQPVDASPSTRKEISITRDEIKLTYNMAYAKLYEHKDLFGKIRKIGLIDLPAFYGDENSHSKTGGNNLTEDVKFLIKKLKEEGIEGLVLDLRRNGGGLVNEAISLSGLFYKNCPVIQIKDTNENVQQFCAENVDVEWTGPIIILVSKFSASASEIVAGALKNSNRAIIFGDSKTHGKGTVQAVIEMDRLSMFPHSKPYLGSSKVTIQKWYLPDGSSTQQRGVPSDIVLPSFVEILPISEADQPNALAWDSITPFQPNNAINTANYTFVTTELLNDLAQNYYANRANDATFAVYSEYIDYMKLKYKETSFSLNLSTRIENIKNDNEYRLQLESKLKKLPSCNNVSKIILLPAAEKDQLAKNNKADNKNFDMCVNHSLDIMTNWLCNKGSDNLRENFL